MSIIRNPDTEFKENFKEIKKKMYIFISPPCISKIKRLQKHVY